MNNPYLIIAFLTLGLTLCIAASVLVAYLEEKPRKKKPKNHPPIFVSRQDRWWDR